VLTEKLDRDERLAFQNQLLKKQDEVKHAIDDMKIAVVAAIKEQTEILGGKLDTLDKSIKSVEQAIIAHHQQMEAQLSKIHQSIERGNATLAELQLEQGDVPNGSLWSLGEFLVSQTAKITLGSVTPIAVAGLIEQNGSSLSAKDIGNIGLTRSFNLPRKGIILKSVCGIGATAGCVALPIFCPIIGIAGTICRMLPF
jgi:prefoldin subunit 5